MPTFEDKILIHQAVEPYCIEAINVANIDGRIL